MERPSISINPLAVRADSKGSLSRVNSLLASYSYLPAGSTASGTPSGLNIYNVIILDMPGRSIGPGLEIWRGIGDEIWPFLFFKQVGRE